MIFEIMFTVSANIVRLKKNDSTPCSATTRRMTLLVTATSDMCDDQREIEKIQIVGLGVLGKIKPADFSVAPFAIIFVRIVDRKDRVDERPRQQDGRDHPQHLGDHLEC